MERGHLTGRCSLSKSDAEVVRLRFSEDGGEDDADGFSCTGGTMKLGGRLNWEGLVGNSTRLAGR